MADAPLDTDMPHEQDLKFPAEQLREHRAPMPEQDVRAQTNEPGHSVAEGTGRLYPLATQK